MYYIYSSITLYIHMMHTIRQVATHAYAYDHNEWSRAQTHKHHWLIWLVARVWIVRIHKMMGQKNVKILSSTDRTCIVLLPPQAKGQSLGVLSAGGTFFLSWCIFVCMGLWVCRVHVRVGCAPRKARCSKCVLRSITLTCMCLFNVLLTIS